jgi:hypothetical protein
MRYAFRLTDQQHTTLQGHLFPGDGLEAAALVLCGRLKTRDRHVFCARRVVLSRAGRSWSMPTTRSL